MVFSDQLGTCHSLELHCRPFLANFGAIGQMPIQHRDVDGHTIFTFMPRILF